MTGTNALAYFCRSIHDDDEKNGLLAISEEKEETHQVPEIKTPESSEISNEKPTEKSKTESAEFGQTEQSRRPADRSHRNLVRFRIEVPISPYSDTSVLEHNNY